MISQTTPAGESPASRARSTAASVCPERLQDAAGAGPQREDVPRLDEVVGGRGRIDRDLDRPRPVGGRDARRDALAGLDRDGERGAERRLVLVGHLPQPEHLAALRRQAEADQPAPVRRHEVDGLGRHELGRDRQVALVLAILVVDDDHEPPGADVLDRLLDGGEDGCSVPRCSSTHRTVQRTATTVAPEARGGARRTSRGRRPRGSPAGPARARDSVVSASVCGISATSNASSCSAAIVSETPSTVIEPFSTQ